MCNVWRFRLFLVFFFIPFEIRLHYEKSKKLNKKQTSQLIPVQFQEEDKKLKARNEWKININIKSEKKQSSEFDLAVFLIGKVRFYI